MSSRKFINGHPGLLAGGDATEIYLSPQLKQETKSEYHVIQHIDSVSGLHGQFGKNVSGASNHCGAFDSRREPLENVSSFRKSFSKNNTCNENDKMEEPQCTTGEKFHGKSAIHSNQLKHLSEAESQAMKTVQYKFDENYLACVQNFTNYCENRKDLTFDGSIFFDDTFFPRSMQLTEYVPINVVTPYIEVVDLQVPSASEYCKFAPCGSTLYDYFEDYQACSKRESILRDQVIFILNSLQCPQLTFFGIDSSTVEGLNIDRYPLDRLAHWNENISSFISRHAKTLKYIQVKLLRYKYLGTTNSISTPKGSFPKLHELTVTLWDNRIIAKDTETDSESDKESEKSVWMPNWLPDSADQYWISLLKSQRHGILTKLCWISAADLNWNEVFQPVIEYNKNTLECLHIVEVASMVQTAKTTNQNKTRDLMNEDNDSPSLSTSNVVLSCVAFSKLCKLKILLLRKPNCYLTNLKRLPETIEELSLDDFIIRTSEMSTLASFPNLKILRLSNCVLPKTHLSHSIEKFGVNKSALKDLLHSRSLQELCIWRHCLELDADAISTQRTSNLTSVLERINAYLANICKSPSKISPSQFCEWNSQQLNQDKLLLEGLEKLGFIDEECVVIHE